MHDEIPRYIYHRTLDHALTEDLTSNTFHEAFRYIWRHESKRIPFWRLALWGSQTPQAYLTRTIFVEPQ